MGRGAAGVRAGGGGVGDFVTAATGRAAEWGDRAGAAAARRFDPARRDGAATALWVFVIYLCGYFIWFAAMIHFYRHEQPETWHRSGFPRGTYNAVAAGSFIASVSALLLSPLIAVREDVHPFLTDAARRYGVATLCALHAVGVLVFTCGMGGFIHNDNRHTPMWHGRTSSGSEQLGATTRQLLMPMFSSACLVYLCVVLSTGREVATAPATAAVAMMAFWLYLTGFFIEFASKGAGAGGGSAGAVAAGAFLAAFSAPPAAALSASGPAAPLPPAARGRAVLARCALHGAGYFIFFCGSCAWLHRRFAAYIDGTPGEYGAALPPPHGTVVPPPPSFPIIVQIIHYTYVPCQNLADVTLYLFVPTLFSTYFLLRGVRQGRALLGGYESVEGPAPAATG